MSSKSREGRTQPLHGATGAHPNAPDPDDRVPTDAEALPHTRREIAGVALEPRADRVTSPEFERVSPAPRPTRSAVPPLHTSLELRPGSAHAKHDRRAHSGGSAAPSLQPSTAREPLIVAARVVAPDRQAAWSQRQVVPAQVAFPQPQVALPQAAIFQRPAAVAPGAAAQRQAAAPQVALPKRQAAPWHVAFPQPLPAEPAPAARAAVGHDSPSVSGMLSLPPAGHIGTQIFRKQALRAYEEGERLTTALRATPPSTWIAVLCISAALGTAAAVCSLCSIDIIARGAGVLRSPGGTRSVAARVSGPIQRVSVTAGSEVQAGQEIATIDSAPLQAELLAAERRVELVERKMVRLRSVDAKLFEQNVELIKRDQALTRERIRSQLKTLSTLAEQGQALRELSGQGIVARVEDREAEERMREVDRTRLTLQQQLTQGEIGLTALQREALREYDAAQTEYESMLAQREAIALRVREATIVAPQAGRIESVVIRPGEMVPEGAVIATIVPTEAPSQVIAFIADRDRAFLVPNAPARLELNQLPSGEFGTLTGKVSAISSGFASSDEVVSVLKDARRVEELSYRVDIRLDDDPKTRKLLSKLRSGTLVTAHVVTRSRRIIALLFDPLRPYFE
jgi:HlyD family secretion protein